MYLGKLVGMPFVAGIGGRVGEVSLFDIFACIYFPVTEAFGWFTLDYVTVKVTLFLPSF